MRKTTVRKPEASFFVFTLSRVMWCRCLWHVIMVVSRWPSEIILSTARKSFIPIGKSEVVLELSWHLILMFRLVVNKWMFKFAKFTLLTFALNVKSAWYAFLVTHCYSMVLLKYALIYCFKITSNWPFLPTFHCFR